MTKLRQMETFRLWTCLSLCLVTQSVRSSLDTWNCTQLTNGTSGSICTVFVNDIDLFECPAESHFDNECDSKCQNNCFQCIHDIRRNESTCTICHENYYLAPDNICRPCPDGCLLGTGFEPVCRAVDGECLHGCIPGYYGSKCDRRCSGYCTSYTCDRLTGCCVEGCRLLHHCGCECNRLCPSSCRDQACNVDCSCRKGCIDGFYGAFCYSLCSENCQESCNESNGHCFYGCRDRKWWGDRCEFHCPSQCRYLTCIRGNGSCTQGCDKEYWYGHNCTKQCNENCIDNTCLQSTGECTTGCKDGWYGPDCSKRCSENCLNKSCYRDNGTCKYKCRNGFHGSYCDVKCSEGCVDMGCDFETGHCFGCINGWFGEKCNSQCSVLCKDLTCDFISGTCSYGCKEGTACGNDPKPSPWAYVSGVLIFVAIALTFVGIVLWKKRHRRSWKEENENDKAEKIHEIENEMYESLSRRHHKDNYQTIGKLDILQFLKSTYDIDMGFVKKEIKILSEELDTFQQEILSPDGAGGDYIVMEFEHENIGMAYRKSKANAGTMESKYKSIDGFQSKKYVIWMGSHEADVIQFLQTIWTLRSSMIVYVVPVRPKSLLEQDAFNITEESSSILAEYYVKKIRITYEDEERLISVLEVREWLESGTLPSVVDFVDFHQRLRGLMKTLRSESPLIVHSGDNLERAGMLLSLDYIVDEIVSTDYVGVRQAVSGLRLSGLDTPWNMETLCYLYEAVAMSVVCGCEPVHRNQLSAVFKNYENLHIDEHFTIKQTFMRRHFDKDSSHTNGVKYTEISFYTNIQCSENESDYYNVDIGHTSQKAIHVDSYRRRNAFICMEIPTLESEACFIHMVMQSDVGLIVLLDTMNENQLPWNITTHTGHLSIAATSVYTYQKLVWNTVMFDDASDEENLRRHVCKYVQYTDWTNSLPELPTILDLLDIVRQEHCQQPDRPILVQSCEKSKCALFCALYNLLEISNKENYFNVMSTVEKIWSRFPGTIISLEQVKFCFEAPISFMKMKKSD